MRSEPILNVIRAYDDWIVRTYCWIRFWILRQRFLDEIGQYLPDHADILDLGSGFGLFSLYYAQILPRARFRGIDLNPGRVEMARRAAGRLGLANVTYEVGDVTAWRADGEYAAAYMLDIVHHVDQEAVRPLLEQLQKALRPGGRLIVKDVDTHPAYKRWFTYLLDRLMTPSGVIRYWPAEELQDLLQDVGFAVYRHLMVDYLPYPHVLYVCQRGE